MWGWNLFLGGGGAGWKGRQRSSIVLELSLIQFPPHHQQEKPKIDAQKQKIVSPQSISVAAGLSNIGGSELCSLQKPPSQLKNVCVS